MTISRGQRTARIWVWVSGGVALAACCAIFVLGSSPDAHYATLVRDCRQSRAQAYVSCLSGTVLQYAYQHPRAAGALLSYVFAHARDGGRAVDLRPLSETAHYAGMELAALPLGLVQALADCGHAFKAACMHGFVMERLDYGARRAPVASFLGFCRPVKPDSGYYENCLHAVGHELWARTRLSLNATLALCAPLRDTEDMSACWSGVLMEYSKGHAVKGRHSHAPAGRRQLPCSSLSAEFHEICTYAEGSYRQYIAGWEPPRTTYERCAAAPRAERLGCMRFVSERLLIAQSGDARLAASTCAALGADKATCYRSITLGGG